MNRCLEHTNRSTPARPFNDTLEEVIDVISRSVWTDDLDHDMTPESLCSTRGWQSMNRQQRRIILKLLTVAAETGVIPIHRVSWARFKS